MFSPRCALCKVRFPYFRASVHSWWTQVLPRASPSQVLSESWFRIVINTKMLGISAQKDIFSQILLKIDHDSGQNTDTAELFNPSYTVSNCQGLSRVVNQSIWNNCTAGNCSEITPASDRKKKSGVLRIFAGSLHPGPGISVLESSDTSTKKILPSAISEPTLCRF